MLVLDLLNKIWHYTMNERYERYSKANRQITHGQQPVTDYCLLRLQESEQWSSSNRVRMASETEGEVIQANGKVFLTNLARRWCSCGHFQENGIPCGHAFSIIRQVQNRSPRDYIPQFFSLTTWRATYSTNLRPVSLEDLSQFNNLVNNQEEGEVVEPTTERRTQGRRQLLRQESGAQRRKIVRAQARLNGVQAPPSHGKGSQACRRCGVYGHNRATCNVELNF